MDNERHENRRNSRKKKNSSRALLILLCLLATAALLLFLYFNTGIFQKKQEQQPDGVSVPTPEISNDIPQSNSLETPPDTVTQTQEQFAVQQQESTDKTGETRQEESATESCSQLEKKLHDFFAHLDEQDYVKEIGLEEKSEPYFLNLAKKLLDNPPIVTRETDNLLSILKNMAHIFRTIGKDNIILIKAILDREQEDIEDVAKAFYRVSIRPRCPENKVESGGDLNNYYDYAGFFLTTIGGRAYLFRRDSKLRLLVNYYSVLIIENANENRMNKYGIDLQQIIPALIGELESTTKLIYKERYLDRLYLMLENYQ